MTEENVPWYFGSMKSSYHAEFFNALGVVRKLHNRLTMDIEASKDADVRGSYAIDKMPQPSEIKRKQEELASRKSRPYFKYRNSSLTQSGQSTSSTKREP